jgi:hypothetical protein
MSVEQIKREMTVLSQAELNEVSAFLFHLRHRHDPDYTEKVEARLSDSDKSKWLTPEEFELALAAK